MQRTEIADVPRLRENVWSRKLLIILGFDQNRTQEADGSIPFSSTILFSFTSLTPRFERHFFNRSETEEDSVADEGPMEPLIPYAVTFGTPASSQIRWPQSRTQLPRSEK